MLVHRIFRLLILFAGTMLAQPYNGTPNGTITYSSGVASNFSGANFITLPTGAVPPAAPWCIEVSAQFNTTTWETVIAGGNWSIGRGPGPFAYIVVGALTIYTGPDIIAPGTPQNIAVCNTNNTEIRAFVNGVYIGNATGSVPALTGTPTIGSASATFTGSISELVFWTVDKYPGTATFTPAASWPNNAAGARAIYHFDGNPNDTYSGSTLLVSGTLTRVTGLEYSGFTGGAGTGTVQLQSYTGACASGTFADDGAALTGQSASTVVRWARDGTVRCYRVRVTVGAETVDSGAVTSPLGGGSWSN